MTSQTSEETRESAKKVLKEYYGYKSEQDVPDGLAAVLEDWLHHQNQAADERLREVVKEIIDTTVAKTWLIVELRDIKAIAAKHGVTNL